MVSKELLSEVMGVNNVRDIRQISNDLIFKCNKDVVVWISIYELACDCKEWVFHNTDFSFSSGIARVVHTGNKNKIGCGFVQVGTRFFHEETEPNAIFKACEWVLKNKKEMR